MRPYNVISQSLVNRLKLNVTSDLMKIYVSLEEAKYKDTTYNVPDFELDLNLPLVDTHYVLWLALDTENTPTVVIDDYDIEGNPFLWESNSYTKIDKLAWFFLPEGTNSLEHIPVYITNIRPLSEE